MSVLSEFVGYLADHGKMAFAIGLAVLILIASGIRWWLEHWRRPAVADRAQRATAGPHSQITQVGDVRTDGDVTISPTQRHG